MVKAMAEGWIDGWIDGWMDGWMERDEFKGLFRRQCGLREW